MKNTYNIYARTPILEVQNLSKSFGESKVLKDINFSVKYGDIVSIIGPPGAGKSTLLRCINALEIPTCGEVFHNGYNIINKAKRVNDYTANVGMVFQSFSLFNNMTILENCMIGILNIYKKDRKKAFELAMKSLEKVGMKSYINFRPYLLSDVQKQKVAIARALASGPEILLLDDPTGGLNSSMAGEVLDIISELANDGMTMIIATNEVEVAYKLSSHIVSIENGVIIDEGSPEAISNKSKNRSVGYFLENVEIAKNTKILVNH